LLEQTVLLSSAHQIVRDNLVICELENIRLAGTAASPCAADPLHSAATSATILSRADLQELFSTLDLSSPSKSRCLVPLNSSVLAVLNAGLAKRCRYSYFERELLSKLMLGVTVNSATVSISSSVGIILTTALWLATFLEGFLGLLLRWFFCRHFAWSSLWYESCFQLCTLVDTLRGCSVQNAGRTGRWADSDFRCSMTGA
jgi:hypothetical protein